MSIMYIAVGITYTAFPGRDEYYAYRCDLNQEIRRITALIKITLYLRTRDLDFLVAFRCARPLSSIIYALISICASVISRGYQSTLLINCRRARARGFMVQKRGVTREYFCTCHPRKCTVASTGHFPFAIY